MFYDAMRIHSGAADITLYDASNGYLFCGYVQESEIKAKAIAHDLISGNAQHWKTRYTFKASLLQACNELLNDISDRRDTTQSIFIVGAHCMVQLDNMYVSLVPKYEFASDGDPHTLLLTAQTEIEADVTKIINFIGEYGQFEEDGNSDGIADNWAAIGTFTPTLSTSWRTGYCQQVYNSAGQTNTGVHNNNLIIPFQSPVHISFSVYAYSQSSPDGSVAYVEVKVYDFDDNLLQTITGTSTTIGYHTEVRLECDGLVVPTVPVKYFDARIISEDANTVTEFDDAQLEIYREPTEFTIY